VVLEFEFRVCACWPPAALVILFLAVLGFELRESMLAKQVFYPLSHSTSLVCFYIYEIVEIGQFIDRKQISDYLRLWIV
jgi:hypothetical protein